MSQRPWGKGRRGKGRKAGRGGSERTQTLKPEQEPKEGEKGGRKEKGEREKRVRRMFWEKKNPQKPEVDAMGKKDRSRDIWKRERELKRG